MAKPGKNEEPEAPAAPPELPPTPKAVAALLVGWFVPGAGHLLLRRWGRGALLLVSVFTMFFLGLAMEGRVYAFNTGDLLDILGFLGDLGAGGLYLLTRMMDWGKGAISLATAAYGTTFIIVAGLLNIISAVDAYHIAVGKKP